MNSHRRQPVVKNVHYTPDPEGIAHNEFFELFIFVVPVEQSVRE